MDLARHQTAASNPVSDIGLNNSLFAPPDNTKELSNLGRLQTEQQISASFDEPKAIRDLRILREEERNSEDPLTHHAFSEAFSLLEFVNLVIDDPLEMQLAADSEGGIRIEWRRQDHIVRIVIPAVEHDEAYI